MRLTALILLTAAMLPAACGGDDNSDSTAVPRPRAYARMALPDPAYVAVDSLTHYVARNAATHVSTIVRDPRGIVRYDISYPGLDAVIYVTETPAPDADTADAVIANRLERMKRNAGDNTTELIELTTPAGDARLMVTPVGSPTPVQLLATRPGAILSAQAFVADAATTRTDSLRPLVSMLRRDLLHLAQTLE